MLRTEQQKRGAHYYGHQNAKSQSLNAWETSGSPRNLPWREASRKQRASNKRHRTRSLGDNDCGKPMSCNASARVEEYRNRISSSSKNSQNADNATNLHIDTSESPRS